MKIDHVLFISRHVKVKSQSEFRLTVIKDEKLDTNHTDGPPVHFSDQVKNVEHQSTATSEVGVVLREGGGAWDHTPSRRSLLRGFWWNRRHSVPRPRAEGCYGDGQQSVDGGLSVEGLLQTQNRALDKHGFPLGEGNHIFTHIIVRVLNVRSSVL